jgi:predicted protein tyrosine phosphatase
MFRKDPVSRERAAQVRAIKEWTRGALALPEETTVLASELRCTEPGCPPLETVVAIMDAEVPRQFKLHKALDAVTYEDVESAAAKMLRAEERPHSCSGAET